MNGPLWTAIGAAVVAVIGAISGIVSSTKANRPAESNAQLAWVKQAQDEAKEARTEAKEAKAESTAAHVENEETRQRQVRLQRQMDAMQDWIDRVVRARDLYIADHQGESDTTEDSGVIRLLKAINGGPHLTQGDHL